MTKDDFGLTDDQRMMRDAARQFAREKLRPNSARWDETGEHPVDVIRELGEQGFYGLLVLEAFGGVDAGYLTLALVVEEIAAGDGALSTITSVMNSVVCGPLLGFGSDAQQQHWLPRLTSGDALGAFCLTEPGAGSDAAALTTKAERTSTGWKLNGTKQFITNGAIAELAIVFAVTDPAAGSKGISAFLVPTDSDGFTVAVVEKKMGQRASDTAQLNFADLELPADALLGREGQGYAIALANLEGGRIGIAAQSIGMARAAYELACDYARERTSFGKPLIKHQAVAFRLAEMATRIEAARQLTHHAARLKDAGEPCLREAAMAKLFASEMAEGVCSDALQTLGGYGYLTDFGVERILRDVRVAQIYEGTSDIQKLVIARSIEEAGA